MVLLVIVTVNQINQISQGDIITPAFMANHKDGLKKKKKKERDKRQH